MKIVLLCSLLLIGIECAEAAENAPRDLTACIEKGSDGKSKIVVTVVIWQDACSVYNIVRVVGGNPKILRLKVETRRVSAFACSHYAIQGRVQYKQPANLGDFTEVGFEHNLNEVDAPVRPACG